MKPYTAHLNIEQGQQMMYGMKEIQKVYSLWKEGIENEQESFTLSFSIKARKEPLIFAGLASVKKYLNRNVFSTEDIAYLHSLSEGNGKLVFPDPFIKLLSLLSFDIELFAPLEGSIFFPGEPVLKVEGNRLSLVFFKKVLKYYVPRQIEIASKMQSIVSYIAPSYAVIENAYSSYGTQSALDVRAAYLGGGVACEDVDAAKQWGIPLCYHKDKEGIVILDTRDLDYQRRACSIAKEKILLKGEITTESLEEFSLYSTELAGVLVSLDKLFTADVEMKSHGYQNKEILSKDFQVFRFSHKGLYIGDMLTTKEQVDTKKMLFGKLSSKVVRKSLLKDIAECPEESIEVIRYRVISNMRLLPCKYRSKDSGEGYPVRILRNGRAYESKESFSNTRPA